MNKKISIVVIIVLIVFCVGVYFILQEGSIDNKENKESGHTFLMIHFEVGGADFPWYKEIAPGADVKNLKYQKVLWPSAIKMVEAANEKNFKLTLCLNPQWAEYILKNEDRIKTVKQWLKQGHEIALHHHGYDHPDWNGFSNREDTKVKNDPRYRGKADKGSYFVKKLVDPDLVITGTITDARMDMPGYILINTYGGINKQGATRWEEAISVPKARVVDERSLIRVGHGFLESYYKDDQRTDLLLKEFKKEYRRMSGGKVFGVVLHVHDFYRYPDAYLQWLDHIESRGDKIQTVKQIIMGASE